MKKTLLTGCLLLAACLSSQANDIHFFTHDYGNAGVDVLYGALTNVSPNGKWAAGMDDDGGRFAYYWSAEDPYNVIMLPVGSEAYDVSNDGKVVGGFMPEGSTSGYNTPGYFFNGEWHELDRSPICIGTAVATCITPDGKVIGGYQMCKDEASEIGGRYWPCTWTLDEASGYYDLKVYTDIPLPEHQGFIIRDISDDGRSLCGKVYCGFASEVPGLLVDGKLVLFNNIEVRSEPFEYQGEILGYFDEYYIDGFHDTQSQYCFVGAFYHFDSEGNVYGSRTVATDVDEEGNGTLNYYACIYNPTTQQWTDDAKHPLYINGLNPNCVFASDDSILLNGQWSDVATAFNLDIELPEGVEQVAGVTCADEAGKVFMAAGLSWNPATFEYEKTAAVITLDEPIFPSGIHNMEADNTSARTEYFDLSGRRLLVPAEGQMVIKRQGSETKKLIVR